MAAEIINPFDYYTDAKGKALEGGKIYVGRPNLEPSGNQIQVYSDEALTQPLAQPIATSGGYPVSGSSSDPVRLYVGEISYSILVNDKNGSLVYSDLNHSGNEGVISFDTISQLRSAPDTTFENNTIVNVLGYYAANDIGGGQFYWDSTSTETDDGGSVIKSANITTGRWKRIFDNETISVRYFGATGDGVTDDSATIQAAIDYAESIEFPEGGIPGGVVRSPTVSFPAATYVCKQLKVQKTVNLLGLGACLLLTDQSSYILLYAPPARASVKGFAFRSSVTVIDHYSNNGYPGATNQIVAENSVFNIRDNCENVGIIAGMSFVEIKECSFENLACGIFAYTGTFDLVAMNSYSGKIDTCRFRTNAYAIGNFAEDTPFQYSGNLKICDNYFSNSLKSDFAFLAKQSPRVFLSSNTHDTKGLCGAFYLASILSLSNHYEPDNYGADVTVDLTDIAFTDAQQTATAELSGVRYVASFNTAYCFSLHDIGINGVLDRRSYLSRTSLEASYEKTLILDDKSVIDDKDCISFRSGGTSSIVAEQNGDEQLAFREFMAWPLDFVNGMSVRVPLMLNVDDSDNRNIAANVWMDTTEKVYSPGGSSATFSIVNGGLISRKCMRVNFTATGDRIGIFDANNQPSSSPTGYFRDQTSGFGVFAVCMRAETSTCSIIFDIGENQNTTNFPIILRKEEGWIQVVAIASAEDRFEGGSDSNSGPSFKSDSGACEIDVCNLQAIYCATMQDVNRFIKDRKLYTKDVNGVVEPKVVEKTHEVIAAGIHDWAGGASTTDSIAVTGLEATDIVTCTLVARAGSETLDLAVNDDTNDQIDLTLSANGTDVTTKISYQVSREL